VAQSGNKETSHLVSPSHEALEWSLFGFSKQLLMGILEYGAAYYPSAPFVSAPPYAVSNRIRPTTPIRSIDLYFMVMAEAPNK
jgi:hypothetical protein